MKRCGKFFMKPRTNLIFTSFYSLLWVTAGIAATTYALNPDTCNLDSNINADGYESGWTAQCNCAKVAMVLVWITCVLWIITMVMALVVFWKQKQMSYHNHQQVVKLQQESEELDNNKVDEGSGMTDIINNMDSSDHHHYSSDKMTPVASTYPVTSNMTSTTEPYLPSSMPAMQYQQPSSITPQPQQPDYYNDVTVSQQHQPLLPLAVMPDPQHYRQQHAFV
ncbi:hypothetical protein BC941DRAFT_437518 [Chlamydoabsidia padenii]|nr:hypothetical protein BC941DRAFT_437518 [Chlamydoabsidia padenii]